MCQHNGQRVTSCHAGAMILNVTTTMATTKKCCMTLLKPYILNLNPKPYLPFGNDSATVQQYAKVMQDAQYQPRASVYPPLYPKY